MEGITMSGHLDYEINKELGECYLFMGDMDKAEEYYKKAAASNGVHPDPYLGLATISVQRGELEHALTLYRKAASIEPCEKSLAGMGLVEAELDMADEAFEHFRQALGKNPECLVALFGLVRLGMTQNRPGDVVSHLENYLSCDPIKHEVRYSLAGCLASVGRGAEAVLHLEHILETEPEHMAAAELLEQLRANAA